MNTSAILNADLSTVASVLSGGVRWWLRELRALAPTSVRRMLRPSPATVALWTGDGFVLTQHGRPLSRSPGARPLDVTLALPSDSALVRVITVPALDARDLGKFITLESERKFPFPPGIACHAFEPCLPDAASPRQSVAIAALPKRPAESILAASVADRLRARRLAINTPDGLRFDFLPALAGDGAMADARRQQQIWVSILGALMALNLAVFIGKDIHRTRQLSDLVTARTATAASAQALSRRVAGEDANRRALVERRAQNDVLGALEITTEALPDGAWVQSLVWEGGQVQLSGYDRAGVDVPSALRSVPEVSALRVTAANVAAEPGLGELYDIAFTLNSVVGR